MMNRQPNTKADGTEWPQETRQAVWQKGTTVEQIKTFILKYDNCGYLICYDDYGKREKVMGWEIDHIVPVNQGGTDELSNLQPLNWQNNQRKADQMNWSWK